MTIELNLHLYDSDTSKTLEIKKAVDVTAFNKEESWLLYADAQRGLIVQLQQQNLRIHYFLHEPEGQKMMNEDSVRFGFEPGQLLTLAQNHAP